MPANKKNTQKTSKKSPLKQIEGKTCDGDEAAGKSTANFPIVGIGASAGGLAAFEDFFSGMPTDRDPEMAFILVQHLAPDHKSILSDLIRRYTRMKVFEVEDGVVVKPNCAYIIPPGYDMAFMDGTLQLLEPSMPRGQRLPIDFFFRSLALDQRERAICIILSGTGSDGTLGVRAIKGEGGMVMVQSPTSTEFDGMPRSAIATGLVDYELQPKEMANQLIGYVEQTFGMNAPFSKVPAAKADNALKKIFILLRAGTGHDFSQYKTNTVNRRIERRMAVQQIEAIENYITFLRQTPEEVEALFRDLLIGVTNFFRDPEAFHSLEQHVIPDLFAGKPPGSTIRVWAPGCSTGEEAYSLAILVQEHMESLKQSFQVQVFATDIDSHAINTARAGIYPASIATDISPERLKRFFTFEPDGSAYRINKVIRDMLVFSEQNLIKDPPFSKLDLLSCRNLLIYINADLQKKLIPLFHYALKPGGVLFLGSSETIGDFDSLFSTIDRKAKLYKRKDDLERYPGTSIGPFYFPTTEVKTTLPQSVLKTTHPERLPLRDLTEQTILQQVVPVAVLVNKKGDIIYLHGRTGMYLELSPGEIGTNVLRMAREGLGPSLNSALQKAAVKNSIVHHSGLQVKTNGDFTSVNMSVHPVYQQSKATNEQALFLIIFEEASHFDQNHIHPVPASTPNEKSDTPHLAAGQPIELDNQRLRQELRIKEEYLQSAIEDLDASNEELKSSNEEMQSVNEELQSTNEELETSKEELQSVNEELATVNAELQTKVADLSQANNDMNNLLAGTGIATVFVDLRQRVLRFTPFTKRIINLIHSDVGRPVGHIVSNLADYNSLVEDVQAVLDTLIPKELDVQTTTGKWYRMRIQPYRTLNNVIEGAVITFVDITESRKNQETIAQVNMLSHLAAVFKDINDAMIVQDLNGAILAWNPSAQRMYGWDQGEVLTMHAQDFIPEQLREEALARVRQLSQAAILEPYRTQRICKNGKIVTATIISTSLVNESGQIYAIATTERLAENT
ncbi:chemotaxis protein CheB [Desulforhopalus sp. IMCC35007]|uniref:chemotaxis protein CheB n=1 Tax=Desulforhopalus sp. IMCC35007 TaxID=2569543 RepID=UPI001F0D1C59|nr:chemotaxis protein CheB [Desulforhopalus sp. IMCC35007]